ncbi:MAG: AI-2E family transporter [Lautropia sp.]
MPVKASLTLLALVALFWFLREAQAFVVPLLIAIVLSFALAPLMRMGQRIRLPVAASASLLIVGVLAVLGLGLSSVAADAADFGARVPQIASDVADRFRRKFGRQPAQGNGVQRQGDRLPASAIGFGADAAGPPAPPPATPAAAHDAAPAALDTTQMVSPTTLQDLMRTTASGVVAGAGHATVVALLTFFFLLSGHGFKRKLIELAGDTLEQKKVALRAVEESARQVQFFLGITLLTNVVIGVLSWAWLQWLGLENSGAWSFAIAVLHTIPYFGAAIGTVLVSAAALIQTDSWAITTQVAAGLTVICSIVGVLVMTFLQGRVARMDPAMVFLGILLFGWLWGVWGVLLGAPILAIARTVAELAGLDRLSTVLKAG